MAKSKQPAENSFKLKYSAEVKVLIPEFQLLPSVKYLDTAALSRASRVKIDVGFFKTPCCERHLRAVIEDGMVTRLEMDSCPDSIPPDDELAAFVKTALKRARNSAPRKWKAMPVKEFLSKAEPFEPPETNCIAFTIFGHTFFCCRTGDGPISCVHISPILLP